MIRGSLKRDRKENADLFSFPWLAAMDTSSRVARAIAQRYGIHAPRALAFAVAKKDRLLPMSSFLRRDVRRSAWRRLVRPCRRPNEAVVRVRSDASAILARTQDLMVDLSQAISQPEVSPKTATPRLSALWRRLRGLSAVSALSAPARSRARRGRGPWPRAGRGPNPQRRAKQRAHAPA